MRRSMRSGAAPAANAIVEKQIAQSRGVDGGFYVTLTVKAGKDGISAGDDVTWDYGQPGKEFKWWGDGRATENVIDGRKLEDNSNAGGGYIVSCPAKPTTRASPSDALAITLGTKRKSNAGLARRVCQRR